MAVTAASSKSMRFTPAEFLRLFELDVLVSPHVHPQLVEDIVKGVEHVDVVALVHGLPGYDDQCRSDSPFPVSVPATSCSLVFCVPVHDMSI